MAIILKVTPESLSKMADEIESQLSDIQNQFTEVESEIHKTRAFWEGDASDGHQTQYESLKDEIGESISRLKNHPVNLLRMAGLYTETELAAKETSQILSADVIV